MRNKSVLIKMEMKLVSEEVILRQQRKIQIKKENNVFSAWEKYTAGDKNSKSAIKLLRTIGFDRKITPAYLLMLLLVACLITNI